MSDIRVSVIIANYNRSSMIEESLDSVLRQDLDGVEIIVSDDGSTDGVREVLRKYEGKIVLLEGRNGGCASARARGIHAAKGRYLAIHDSDDVMLEGRLKTQAAFLDEHEEVAAVTGNLILSDDETVNHLEASGVDFQHRPFVIYDKPFKMFLKRSIMADPATMFRKEAYIDVGGYDTSLPVSADLDLWLRMSRKEKMACMNTPCTWYRVHPGNKSASPIRIATLLRILEKTACAKDPLSPDEQELLLLRIYNTLVHYIKINVDDGFDADWRSKVLFYSRHLTPSRRLRIRLLGALPAALSRTIIDNKKSLKEFWKTVSLDG